MRLIGFALMMVLAGCSRVPNTFTVHDPGHLVRSANLRLCGTETPLVRMNNEIELSLPINCEGEGQIALTYEDNRMRGCHVGYVTPGAKQAFRFRAEPSSCLPL